VTVARAIPGMRDGYTIRDLQLCLGEDYRKIQRWIASG
jgi:hypothetical protein